MKQAFRISIDAGIAELVIDKAPVNALDSAEWFALAGHIDALLAERARELAATRNLVFAAIALVLACVAVAFFGAYMAIMRGLRGLAAATVAMARQPSV